MRLNLIRDILNENYTMGKLYINDNFYCYTLEDAIRQEKIYGQTAIPYGTYEVIINYSNKYQKMMPLLLNVPNFTGVRIHSGNTPEDTEGCILVGMKREAGRLWNSRAAYYILFKKIEHSVLNKEQVFISIEKGGDNNG